MFTLRPLLSSLFAFSIGSTALTTRGSTPDETARYIAGLPMQGTSLETAAKEPQWVKHATDFDTSWRELNDRSLAKIKEWAPEYLAPQYENQGNVFYFFSGPDLLYAQALWPNAQNYVLVAREPVGALPDIEAIPADKMGQALENLHKTLNAVLSFSFFITQDMKSDLTQTQLTGTLPVIMLFAARANCKVTSVEFIGLDPSGAVTQDPKPATHGVKIGVIGPHGRPQNIYYFEADLGDGALKRNGAVLKFCEQLGRGSSLLKAASYLLHGGGFDIVRKWVLANSDLIAEDDSGIPFRYFTSAKWEVRLCGHYPGPIPRFKKRYQTDLFKAYKNAAPPPLGFSFGYQWQPSRSGMLLARPK